MPQELPRTLGVKMKALFQGFDRPLTLILFLLIGLGFLTLSSASDGWGNLTDQARNLMLTFILMCIIVNLPIELLMRIAVPLYSVGIALLLAVALFGVTKKGARRWLNVGFVIQPSEILKIAVPLMLAWYYEKREGHLKVLDYLIIALILLVPVLLIARQPDLGTAMLVFSTGFFVIFLAGFSYKILVPIFISVMIAVSALFIFEGEICQPNVQWPLLHAYQKHRVCTLLNPALDPLGKGFHTLQSAIAIGSGGMFGKGYMEGTQSRLEFIPEKNTDFIFAVYAEEFGFVGIIVLLLLYIAFVTRGLYVARKGVTLFGRLVAGSLTLSIFFYAFINIGMVSGILPVVGVPLPFISYGGTALTALGVAVAMIMNIGRQRSLIGG